jgi:hypothetical protein
MAKPGVAWGGMYRGEGSRQVMGFHGMEWGSTIWPDLHATHKFAV